jgi:hypothetical protein
MATKKKAKKTTSKRKASGGGAAKLKLIVKEAKAIRAKNPKKKWTDCIKAASKKV